MSRLPVQRTLRTVVVALLLASAVILTGCTGSPRPSQVTALPPSPTVLQMAHIDEDPGTDVTPQWFMDEVDKRSGGALQVTFAGECCGRGTGTEQTLISDVVIGAYPLGWVGTRSFADFGVPAVAPLTAPFLIDSYALEKAVLQSPVAAEMVAGLADENVTALALVPGLLRRPITSDTPVLTPADWAGIRFQVFPSTQSAAAVAALGATPTQLGSDERDTGLGDRSLRGYEDSMTAEAAAHRVPSARVALNEVLWPRTSALIANPQALDELTDKQVKILRDAAAAVVARTQELAQVDAQAVTEFCTGAGRIAQGTPSDVAALQAAVRPALDAIAAADPTGSLDAIQQLKSTVVAEDPVAVPDTCRP